VVLVVMPGHFLARAVAHGSLRIACVPTLRHTMWGSPSTTLWPYSKVARPSPAQVISKTPVAPFTPFTRSPLRNARPRLMSSTNCATAARNTACRLADIESKSALNRANHAKVGNDPYADVEERRPRLA
jgi:hypothetical protein